MAVKLAVAMGARVTVFTTTPEKGDEARRLGAVEVVDSTRKKQMEKHALSLDFILSTIPEPHDINPYVACLKRDATLVVVGALAVLKPGIDNSEMAFHRQSVAGSLIGGLAETQEVLDFCAEHGITADVEIIPIQQINKAFDRMQDGDVRFRYVIDMASLRDDAEA
jgi:uncharacterized zinc-type alcohol dehydrogenase-like protein